jgi:hypothetical protein
MAREVQVGEKHIVAYGPKKFEHTQSGLFGKNILCGDCDGQLGALENKAVQAFRNIRKAAKTTPFGEFRLENVSGNDILRFACGVLWKYSVASKEKGRIDLGPYQNIARAVAFSEVDVPPAIDAVLIRLKRTHDDDDVFAYRAPKPDRQEGVNGYRMLVGGIFIFLKIDKQRPSKGTLTRGSIQGHAYLPYAVMPAQAFEEFRSAAALVHSDGKASAFIDKIQVR